MLKYGGDSVHSALYRVILGIWRAEQAPQDFKQDILLPIPKKGDASLCSNYRTIALQSIAGKAYANVLSARLSQWLADNLLDEQCGFRPSRSTVDALFSLRLLCNGAWDKGRTLHICMLDLTKAFDSVDREMAWQILLSRGAPPKLVATYVFCCAKVVSETCLSSGFDAFTLSPDCNSLIQNHCKQLKHNMNNYRAITVGSMIVIAGVTDKQ